MDRPALKKMKPVGKLTVATCGKSKSEVLAPLVGTVYEAAPPRETVAARVFRFRTFHTRMGMILQPLMELVPAAELVPSYRDGYGNLCLWSEAHGTPTAKWEPAVGLTIPDLTVWFWPREPQKYDSTPGMDLYVGIHFKHAQTGWSGRMASGDPDLPVATYNHVRDHVANTRADAVKVIQGCDAARHLMMKKPSRKKAAK